MSFNPETPSSDEIASALGEYLTQAGLPPVLGSIVDHLMVLFYMETCEPEYYWMGASPEEKTHYHGFEITAVRSILAAELAEISAEMQAPDINTITLN